jgi:hypothetical protein
VEYLFWQLLPYIAAAFVFGLFVGWVSCEAPGRE